MAQAALKVHRGDLNVPHSLASGRLTDPLDN